MQANEGVCDSQFEKILKLLHPIMPFISEEAWHIINDKKEDIIVSQWPETKIINKQLLTDFGNTQEIISNIRNIRKEQNIGNKKQLDIFVICKEDNQNNFISIISRLAG